MSYNSVSSRVRAQCSQFTLVTTWRVSNSRRLRGARARSWSAVVFSIGSHRTSSLRRHWILVFNTPQKPSKRPHRHVHAGLCVVGWILVSFDLLLRLNCAVGWKNIVVGVKGSVFRTRTLVSTEQHQTEGVLCRNQPLLSVD
ncbi:hypothetical protein WMY93_011691 [Mugilogobius chulae]|uniref:Uncharacterized protein n=1 Tax=Mugilogobius chulae TaxID=88201 RepID=A0AAW0P4P2_9GOBI